MLLVYGGSFNPPTIAHYEIAKLLIEKYNSKILFVPVGNSYNKDDLVSFEHRYNMLKLMISNLNADVLSLEDNSNYLGTYELLSKLKTQDEELYFILGSDNLDYIEKWINAYKLISEFKFIVLTRNNYDCKSKIAKLSHPNNFSIFEVNYEMSSSDFRKYYQKELITTVVLEYIEENNLYENTK